MKNYDQKERLAHILKTIEKEKIRFPVADFVKRFDINAGHASTILKGGNNVSDKFWLKFLEAFPMEEKILPSTSLIHEASIEILFKEVAKIKADLFPFHSATEYLAILENKRNELIEQKTKKDSS